jgi:hypothetical protein
MKWTVSAAEGFGSVGKIPRIAGTLLSIVYTPPVMKFPLPVPTPFNGLRLTSTILSSSTRSKRKVPSPVPALTLIV